jgi:hypothetical protein
MAKRQTVRVEKLKRNERLRLQTTTPSPSTSSKRVFTKAVAVRMAKRQSVRVEKVTRNAIVVTHQQMPLVY